VQVAPIKPKFKAPGTKRLKLECDGPLSNFAFELNLRCYIMAKYNHLICAQVYGSAGNDEKDEQLNELMAGR